MKYVVFVHESGSQWPIAVCKTDELANAAATHEMTKIRRENRSASVSIAEMDIELPGFE